MRKISKFLSIVALGLLVGGCSQGQKAKQTESKTETKTSQKATGDFAQLSQGRDLFAWTVYWDVDKPWLTIQKESQNIDAVGTFAAFYDENKNYELFLADGSKKLDKEMRTTAKTSKIKRYMTVVNDTRTADKSTDLLETLLSSKANADKHAKEVAALAKKYNFTGVEIDYEQIRDNLSLWKKFLVFEKALYARTKRAGLDLRIVLEPSTPVSKINFPKGPEYVVMCYNLYGYGTNPGPKADYKFLKKTVKDFSSLGNVSYALSNGGFDFNGDDVTSVTGLEALKIKRKYKAMAVRDKKSGALYFKYGSHTVWYADQTTLQLWAKTLDKASGKKVGISIWRME